MRKKLLFVIAPLFFLACNFLFPAAQQDENPLPTPPKAGSSPLTLSTPEVESTSTFTIVRVNKKGGGLLSQLNEHAQKAKELGYSPFIEFDATWCPSCYEVNESLKAKELMTMKAFEGVYLIRADVDEWGWGDGKNFRFNAIPIYYQLDENGKPTGAVIDGGEWGEDIPQNFAPVLDKFFHTQ